MTTDPVAVLMGEHRHIEAVLTALEHFAVAVSAGRDHAELRDFVRFLREYADHAHHAKEEDILFAAIVEEGLFPVDMGPVTVMLDEHAQGRHATQELADLAEQTTLSPADRRHLVEVASGYVALLRHHIAKEDGVLFPLAGARLDPRVMEEVARQFDRFALDRAGADLELVDLGRSLVAIGRST